MSSMTRNVSVVSVSVGIIELIVAPVSVILGIVAVTSYSGHPSNSTGIWALVFFIPGTLSIVAGRTKSTVTLAVALFFNILATIISSVATLICVSFWMILEYGCYKESYNYKFKCSSYPKVYAIVITMTIVLIILAITSFTGSVMGCVGTCCSAREPIIITTIPAPPSTVVIGNQSSGQQEPSYYPMIPQNTAGSVSQAYTGVPVQSFGFQFQNVSQPVSLAEPEVESDII